MTRSAAIFFACMVGLASFALRGEIDARMVKECPAQIEGRRVTVVYPDGSCAYERPQVEVSPTELRRMANARERMGRVR